MVWVPFNAEYASTVGETISSVVQQVSMHMHVVSRSGSSAGFIQCGIWPACPHLVHPWIQYILSGLACMSPSGCLLASWPAREEGPAVPLPKGTVWRGEAGWW